MSEFQSIPTLYTKLKNDKKTDIYQKDLLHDTGWSFYIDKWIIGKQQYIRVRFGSKILFYEYFKNGLQDLDLCQIQVPFFLLRLCIIKFILRNSK